MNEVTLFWGLKVAIVPSNLSTIKYCLQQKTKTSTTKDKKVKGIMDEVTLLWGLKSAITPSNTTTFEF